MGLEHMTYGIPMRTMYPNGKILSQKFENVMKNKILV